MITDGYSAENQLDTTRNVRNISWHSRNIVVSHL